MVETLADATAAVLTRMLQRLPHDLWDTDPASPTVQRELYAVIAAQVAVWLEQRTIARTMTLLREAEGVDLDTLLADYGLRRYLGLADATARQIGMQILWYPQGTLYSVERLADLLFAPQAHVTLRTGVQHQHVLVAMTRPITTPHSYWRLVSADGQWYALTVDAEVPILSTAPPPGLDVTPGDHTLTWFRVSDEVGTFWYISVQHASLHPSLTAPGGHGTTEPFAVLDGLGNRWSLAIDHGSEALVTVLNTGLVGFGYWRITARDSTLYRLWIEAHVPMIGTSAPGGATDQTPGGSALDWLTALDETGAAWYVTIQDGTLFAQTTQPAGGGTAVLAEWLDVSMQRWVLSVARDTEALLATPMNLVQDDLVVVTPSTSFQAFRLLDPANVSWWLSLDVDTFSLTETLPAGAIDATPAGGPYHWWRVYDLAQQRWYVSPSTWGTLVVDTVSPGGTGTALPSTLGDVAGVVWHAGVDVAGVFALSDAPPVRYDGQATALCLTDAAGGRWFWRVHGEVLEWSSTLWPNTLDQSPWGSLGWIQLRSSTGERRYVFPTTLGDPMAAAGPPLSSPWGWTAPVTFVDAAATRWHLNLLTDDVVGILADLPDDLPFATEAVSLGEAMEALAHVQAAGSALTLLLT